MSYGTKKKYFNSQGYQLFVMKQKHLPEEFYSYLIITAQTGMGQNHHLRGYFYAAKHLRHRGLNLVAN